VDKRHKTQQKLKTDFNDIKKDFEDVSKNITEKQKMYVENATMEAAKESKKPGQMTSSSQAAM
jgi:hypothetical protein